MSDIAGKNTDLAKWNPDEVYVYTTLDPIDTLNAIQASKSIDETQGKPILITDMVLHQVELTSPTGEIVKQTRTIVKTKDGKLYNACSDGIVSSLKLIAALLNNPPWPDGIKVQLQSEKTNHGYNVKKLVCIK
jgi:hypothetical protein